MSRHQVGILASKLLGIYFAVNSLGYLSSLGMQFSLGNPATVAQDAPFMLTVSLGCFFLVLGTGLFMVFRAEKVSTFLLGPDSPEVQSVVSSVPYAQVIAYTTIGFLLTFQAFPRLVNIMVSTWFSLQGWMPRHAINARSYIDLFTALLQVALGAWLVFGARGLAEILAKVRGESVN